MGREWRRDDGVSEGEWRKGEREREMNESVGREWRWDDGVSEGGLTGIISMAGPFWSQ